MNHLLLNPNAPVTETLEQKISRLESELAAANGRITQLEPYEKWHRQLRVDLSPEMKAWCERYLADLDERLRQAPETSGALDVEISKLDTLEHEINGSIEILREQAMTDDAAASLLLVKERRLLEIQTRKQEVQEQRAAVKPVTLAGAGQLLSAIVRGYAQCLVGKVTLFLEPIAPIEANARAMAKMSGAVQALHILDRWALSLDQERATVDNVGRLTSILKRAMRGEPHLGSDFKIEDYKFLEDIFTDNAESQK